MKINGTLIILLIFLLSACGGRRQQSEREQPLRPQTELEQAVPESVKASISAGKEVYQTVCLACHMENGTGVPGMYPPLANSDWVNGDKDRLIRITIQGVSGKIEVNGSVYNNTMPPNSHLSDKEIADVLTYIRHSFGNNASEITVQEVQKVRNDL